MFFLYREKTVGKIMGERGWKIPPARSMGIPSSKSLGIFQLATFDGKSLGGDLKS